MSILDFTMWSIIIASFISWPIYARCNKLIRDEEDYIMAVVLWFFSAIFMWAILAMWIVRIVFGQVKGEQK